MEPGVKTMRKRAKSRRSRISRSVLTLCALFLACAAPQARAADPGDVAIAKELMNTCQAHIGDRRSAEKAFRSMGTRTVNHNANFRSATANAGRVFISSGVTRNWIGCIVVVEDMGRSEATKLATPWVERINGISDKPRNGASTWTGAYGGKLARVEIGSISNPVITGTGITFEVNKRLKPNTKESQ
ncbi:hypothetical protein [Sedimentitalea sp.]|uniref:hypothetical protein n=1 Tax=Sedimentitalea sp. TaxID=2048915 RepID=UPI003296D341